MANVFAELRPLYKCHSASIVTPWKRRLGHKPFPEARAGNARLVGWSQLTNATSSDPVVGRWPPQKCMSLEPNGCDVIWKMAFEDVIKLKGLELESSRIIHLGPKPEDQCVPVGRNRSQTQSRRPCDHGDRDWSDSVTSQGTLEPPEARRCEEGLSGIPWAASWLQSLAPRAHTRLLFPAQQVVCARLLWWPQDERTYQLHSQTLLSWE